MRLSCNELRQKYLNTLKRSRNELIAFILIVSIITIALSIYSIYSKIYLALFGSLFLIIFIVFSINTLKKYLIRIDENKIYSVEDIEEIKRNVNEKYKGVSYY